MASVCLWPCLDSATTDQNPPQTSVSQKEKWPSYNTEKLNSQESVPGKVAPGFQDMSDLAPVTVALHRLHPSQGSVRPPAALGNLPPHSEHSPKALRKFPELHLTILSQL